MTTQLPRPSGTDPAVSLIPTLPGRFYTSDEIFAQEQRQIFATQWNLVGRTEQVPNVGDFLRVEIAGTAVIVVRARKGLRAYLNVCRHRGSQLCLTDNGNTGKSISCPYHAWQYSLDDGALRNAPNWRAMTDVDKSGLGLATVAVDEWKGLIWVNLAGSDGGTVEEQIGAQLRYRLGGDLDRVDRFGLENLVVGGSYSYECEANWKIIFENFQECYHCGTIHPELVEQIPTFASFEELGTGGYHTNGYNFAPDKEGFTISGKRALPMLPGLLPTDDTKYIGMILRPNAFLSFLPDHVILHRFEPVSATHTRLTCEWLFDPAVVNNPDYDLSGSIELFHLVNKQDLDASAWCQPNMSSPLYERGGVLVPTESEIIGHWFYPWYRAAMGIPDSAVGGE